MRANLRLPGQLELLVQAAVKFVRQGALLEEHGCSNADRRRLSSAAGE